MAKRRKRGRKKTRRKSARRRATRSLWVRIAVLLGVLLAGYIVYLDFQVRHQFAGKRWSLPARVYARPLELYAGLELTAEQFVNVAQAEGKGIFAWVRASNPSAAELGGFTNATGQTYVHAYRKHQH